VAGIALFGEVDPADFMVLCGQLEALACVTVEDGIATYRRPGAEEP
jgi:hypothetical protein